MEGGSPGYQKDFAVALANRGFLAVTRLHCLVITRNGSISHGIFIGFPSTQMVEMAAYNGFDVIVIDNEHGMLSEENIEHMVIAAELAGATPLFNRPD